jgi:hypothetical protein
MLSHGTARSRVSREIAELEASAARAPLLEQERVLKSVLSAARQLSSKR